MHKINEVVKDRIGKNCPVCRTPIDFSLSNPDHTIRDLATRISDLKVSTVSNVDSERPVQEEKIPSGYPGCYTTFVMRAKHPWKVECNFFKVIRELQFVPAKNSNSIFDKIIFLGKSHGTREKFSQEINMPALVI